MERVYENRFAQTMAMDQDLNLTFNERATGSIVIFLEGPSKEMKSTFRSKIVFSCQIIHSK